MRKAVTVIASIPLFLLSIFFIYVISYLIGSDIVPALEQGTLSVDTNTMILDRVWEGNEIYLLILAYAVLAVAFAYGGYRLLRFRI